MSLGFDLMEPENHQNHFNLLKTMLDDGSL